MKNAGAIGGRPAPLSRRALVTGGLALGAGMWMGGARAAEVAAETPALAAILDEAAGLKPLQTVIVAHHGEIIAERGYGGHSVARPTNIKSASKAILSALVGIAIDRKVLEGVDQRVADILRKDLPKDPDPRLERITIGNLLSMQAGLRRTSGANYGRWVSSPNWVRSVLAEPFEDDPGGRMLYSTGSSHLLSAILTQLTGRSTLANARAWLAPVEGFAIAGWSRDPQGIYAGGNDMSVTPRALLAFGEVYRSGGRAANGVQVVPAEWIEQSWTLRTHSAFTGDGYGYGWFLRTMDGETTRYAWGYGGQMLYIVPRLGLIVVMTCDSRPRPRSIPDRDALRALMVRIIGTVR